MKFASCQGNLEFWQSQGKVWIFFIKFNIQRFSFLFVYYISQNIWLRQKINEKINKEKPFAILEFACKMLQKLSSKMLKCCPLQYSVVLKSLMFRHLRYMANSPQSAVSECSVISVAASSCNNKEVEVTRLRWYYTCTSAVQVWFLNCRSTTKIIFHRSDLFRMKALTHSCMNKLPRESREDAELLQTMK